jgi:polysaccharide pyruvyl transferase WcaK-like protein
VVQGCDLLLPHAPAIAEVLRSWIASHPGLIPVLVATGRCRGDALFADAMERLLPSPCRRLPDDAPIEDVAATISGACAFVGSSLHGAITAHAYGRPFVVLNLAGESKLDGFGALTGTASQVIRTSTDLHAALATATARLPGKELAARPSIERLQAAIDSHFDRIAEIAEEAARSRSPVDGVAYDRLVATRTFRYSHPLRRVYRRLRRQGGLDPAELG